MMHAVFLAMLLCLAAAADADDRFPIEGAWGFDWLHPATARCRRITAKDAAGLRDCRYSKQFAFGLDMHAHACKTGAHAEYVIFRTRQDCREAFETMQANAP